MVDPTYVTVRREVTGPTCHMFPHPWVKDHSVFDYVTIDVLVKRYKCLSVLVIECSVVFNISDL